MPARLSFIVPLLGLTAAASLWAGATAPALAQLGPELAGAPAEAASQAPAPPAAPPPEAADSPEQAEVPAAAPPAAKPAPKPKAKAKVKAKATPKPKAKARKAGGDPYAGKPWLKTVGGPSKPAVKPRRKAKRAARAPRPRRAVRSAVHYHPPVVRHPPLPRACRPQPVVGYEHHPARVRTVRERVLVRPGEVSYRHHPARYRVVRKRVLVQRGHWRKITYPAHYRIRHVRREIAPPRYGWRKVYRHGQWHRQRVLLPPVFGVEAVKEIVRPTRRVIEYVPERYEMRERVRVVRPAWREKVVSPPVYRTVTRRVLVAPAQRVAVPRGYRPGC